MKLHRLAAWAFISGVAVAASAQTSPGTPVSPVVQRSPGGIAYLSGGAGEEERATMTSQQAEFPVRVVLSATGGEYIVVDKLSVIAPQGELLTVRDAGPLLMMKLPPGTYTIEATWQGRTERRELRAGSSAQTLNWRFNAP